MYIKKTNNKFITVPITDLNKITLGFFRGTNKRVNAVKRGKNMTTAKLILVGFISMKLMKVDIVESTSFRKIEIARVNLV